jgi:hypothetical protein
VESGFYVIAHGGSLKKIGLSKYSSVNFEQIAKLRDFGKQFVRECFYGKSNFGCASDHRRAGLALKSRRLEFPVTGASARCKAVS